MADKMTKHWGKTDEVRLNDDGSIDEIVLQKPRFVHIEQMDNGFWWMGITNSKGVMLHVTFATKHRAHIRCRAESEDGKICEGFDHK